MLEDLQPPKKNHPCKVRTILATLDDKDKAILNAAIADHTTWPASTLSKELKKRGLVVVDNTITRHRDGTCSCSKI